MTTSSYPPNFNEQVNALLTKSDISDDVKKHLLSIYADQDKEGREGGRWVHNTPLAIALTGLITIGANFAVDWVRGEQQATNSITLEQLKGELDRRAKEAEADLQIKLGESTAALGIKAEEKRFQFEIVRSELAKEDISEADRARTLLFLAKSGVLNSLNTAELEEMAQQVLKQSAEEEVAGIIPQLTSPAGREELGFGPESDIQQEVRARLQSSFGKFREYLVKLGYSPGSASINVKFTTQPSAFYSNNTIFLPKTAAEDPEIIYREYLHHVLYSKVGVLRGSPQGSAIESGLADYLVASYTNNPLLYEIAFAPGRNLDHNRQFRHALTPEDRFLVGDLWAGMFWEIRQVVGSERADKILLSAWFDLPRDVDDRLRPAMLIEKILQQPDAVRDESVRASVLEVLKKRGFPTH